MSSGILNLCLCIAVTTSFLGRYWWGFELASHFRLQYLYLGPPALLLAYITRRWALASATLTLTILNASIVWPYAWANHSDTPAQDDSFTSILINVNKRTGSPHKVAEFLEDTQPDFFVLQEIDQRWISELSPILSQYPHQISEPRDDNFGIGLFSKHPLTSPKLEYFSSIRIPSISAQIPLKDRSIRLLTSHPLPPRNSQYSEIRNEQLESMARHLSKTERPTLLIGDLNCTQYSHYFQKFLNDSELIDPSAEKGIQSTWPTFLPIPGIQIDHCLHSEDIIIEQIETGPNVGSDHYPLVIHFRLASDRNGAN